MLDQQLLEGQEERELHLGEPPTERECPLSPLCHAQVDCMEINDLNFQTCKERQKWEFKVK